MYKQLLDVSVIDLKIYKKSRDYNMRKNNKYYFYGYLNFYFIFSL